MLREQSWGLLLCSNYCNKPMMTTSTTEENHLRDAWQRTFSTHRCTIHVLKSHLDIFPMRYDMISSKVVHFMLFMGGKCVFLLFQKAFSPFVNHHKHCSKASVQQGSIDESSCWVLITMVSPSDIAFKQHGTSETIQQCTSQTLVRWHFPNSQATVQQCSSLETIQL